MCDLLMRLSQLFMYFIRNLARMSPALVACCLAGCIGLIPSPFRPSPGPQKAPQPYDIAQAFDIVCRNYRLGPGDQVGILFLAEWSIPYGTFKLDTLDELEIKFILDPQLNEKVIVRPDGMITLQGVGEIQAAGLTPNELAKRIEDKYIEAEIFSRDETKAALKNYKLVTVHVVQFYQKIKKLLDAVTSLATGGRSSITVNPDGTIDLPLISERVLAAGHTIAEVENTINRLYRSGPIKHMSASLALTSAQSRKFYVMGEGVGGAFDIKQPITILHALAMAGNAYTKTADLTSVILISRDIHGKPIGRRIDVKRMLDVGDLGSNILVKPYDVIFVPRTYIDDLNTFVEQYLGVVARFKAFADVLK